MNALYAGRYRKDHLKTVVNEYLLEGKAKPDPEAIAKNLADATKNYLVLSKRFDALKTMNGLKDASERIAFCSGEIADAAIAARQRDEYIIEIQFAVIEWFLYAVWFLLKPSESVKLFDRVLACSFRYPNIDFEKQHAACCRTAKASAVEQQEPEAKAELLENVYRHFIFNLKTLNRWEKSASKTIGAAEIRDFRNKICEWTLVHYLMPLYVCVRGFSENDDTFYEISRKLYYYEIDGELLSGVIDLLLDTGAIADELNSKRLQKMYGAIKTECEKIVCRKMLFGPRQAPNNLNQ